MHSSVPCSHGHPSTKPEQCTLSRGLSRQRSGSPPGGWEEKEAAVFALLLLPLPFFIHLGPPLPPRLSFLGLSQSLC